MKHRHVWKWGLFHNGKSFFNAEQCRRCYAKRHPEWFVRVLECAKYAEV